MEHKRLVINVETGEQYEENLMPQEVAELEAAFARAETEASRQAEVAAAKASLLEKLGITEEEAKLLLS